MASGRRFLVRLDVEKIRASLSRADGIKYDAAYVSNWLDALGIEQRGDAWIVPEAELGHFDPTEVSDVRLLDENDEVR